MSFAAAHPHPADQADQQAEDGQYYRRVLHELIDMGADLARAVRQQATCLPDPAGDTTAMSMDDAAVAIDRISRAIRRTIALARKIAEPLPPRATTSSGQHRTAARRSIIREVEDVIQRTVDGAEAEALHVELSERMDAPELEDEIDHRPVAEVIADFCRDLGIAVTLGAHSWKCRTPRNIEALCARAAQPRAARSPTSAHAAPANTEPRADPPALQLDAGTDLLQFTFPVRGTLDRHPNAVTPRCGA